MSATNTDPFFYAGVLAAAFAVSWALVSALRRLAPQIGLLDRPNARSLHTRVTPRGGGIGFVLAAVGLAGLWLARGGVAAGLETELAVFLGGAAAVAAVSLRDDFRPVGAGWRFLCHLAAAGAAVAFIGPIKEIALPGIGALPLGWAGPALTIVWIVGLTNVYNFMDGIDGIAGMQGVMAGLVWALTGAWLSLPAVTLLGLVLAGGCGGFLPHNWSPAKIFMGDVGSAFLGYCFAVLPLVALRELEGAGGATGTAVAALPAFGLLVMWPFVGDGFFTFVRRARRLEPVWKAHRSHLYQKLVRTGWSHARVATLYGGWGVLSAASGLLWLSGAPGGAVAALVSPPASLAGMYFLVALRERGAGGDR